MANEIVNKINAFNEKQNKFIQQTNVVVLRKYKTKLKPTTERLIEIPATVQIVLVKSNEEETIKIKQQEKLTEKVLQFLKDNNIIQLREEVKVVYYCGDLRNYTATDEIVYKFPQRRVDIKNNRPERFRDYSKTLEQQKNIMSLVNTAPTADISWKTAIRKVGSNFGLLLKIVTEN
jgi:transcriptional regulator with AAA-type ATPase domain